MVIGGGQIAKAFSDYSDNNKVLIFASGVSNSSELDERQFKKEEALIRHHLSSSVDKQFVYFSSCAVHNNLQNNTPYYKHKIAMEKLIRAYSSNGYIFRLPQLFGDLKRHPTLINYLYYKILDDEKFSIFDKAYRYVIHVNDIVTIVKKYLLTEKAGHALNIANPYAYSIREIVECLEIKAEKKAIYKTTKKRDEFTLDLDALLAFTETNNMDFAFGKNYLYKNLGVKLP